jgi:hypothetical protein
MHTNGQIYNLPPETTQYTKVLPGLCIIPCRPVTVPYNEDEGDAQSNHLKCSTEKGETFMRENQYLPPHRPPHKPQFILFFNI